MAELTVQRFLEVMPQFCGITPKGKTILSTHLEYVNRVVCCNHWGDDCERAASLLAAHYLSQDLQLLTEAEEEPELAGGVSTVSDTIASEKVGEVEVKFHKPVHLNAGFSNEHNDPLQEELKTTIYGRRYLSMKKGLGFFIATTGDCFRL